MLKIALPAGKSLEEGTRLLFEEARITLERKGSAHQVRFPDYKDLSEGVFIKPRRIPLLVAEGDFDIGITGRDTILESDVGVEICAELEYGRATSGKTRAVLFVAADDPIMSAQEVPQGSLVLSEYPSFTKKFFLSLGKSVYIIESPGSAEAEVPLKYRFGVALSETGKSLQENGLKPVETLFESSTVLIANKSVAEDQKKAEALRALRLILTGVLEARGRVLLSLNVSKGAKKKVLGILPALRTPTITGLVGGEYISVSAVVKKGDVNSLLPSLLQAGAEDVLVMPISAMIHSW